MEAISKFSIVVVTLLFGTAVALLGVREINQRYSGVSPDRKVSSDTFIRDLHGDVNLTERSVESRERRGQQANERAATWDSVKRFFGTFVP